MVVLRMLGGPAEELAVEGDWFHDIGARFEKDAPEHRAAFAPIDGPYDRLRVGPETLDGVVRALRALVATLRRPHEQQVLRGGGASGGPPPAWAEKAIEAKLQAAWPQVATTREVIAFLERAAALGEPILVEGD